MNENHNLSQNYSLISINARDKYTNGSIDSKNNLSITQFLEYLFLWVSK